MFQQSRPYFPMYSNCCINNYRPNFILSHITFLLSNTLNG